MRPRRLEIEGFTAFRERAEIDLDGVGYFALSGATGSGKSSVIDAMVFALYGCVPRLDKRMVAPVVTLGELETRVRLDFTVGGEEYTAVRVVRRTKQGVVTKEARLERGDDVLAGDADGLGRAVEELLGLSYDQFTTCVVLPQGEFARFLHDKPSERQDLLVRLLDLGVFGQMMQRANQIADGAAGVRTVQLRRLDDLAFATPEGLGAERARLRTLDALAVRVDEEQPRLQKLAGAAKEAAEEAARAGGRVAGLEGVKVPSGVGELDARFGKASTAAAAAEGKRRAAEETVRAAEEARRALPDRAPLDAAAEAHRQLAETRAGLERARAEQAPLAQADAQAQEALERAQTAEREARDAVDAASRAEAAAVLAGTLRAGEPCPVCLQEVHEVPRHPRPPALRKAETARQKAQREIEKAEQRARETARARTTADGRIEALARTIGSLEERLGTHGDPDALAGAIRAIEQADGALEAARRAEAKARAAEEEARRALDAVRGERERAWRTLDAARDSVAELSPPPPERADLVADWRRLVAWCAEQAVAQRAGAEAAAREATEKEQELASLAAELVAVCERAQVTVEGANVGAAVAAARAEARLRAERIQIALEEAERLRAEIAGLERDERVARSLGQHLNARNFEAWVLEETLRVLVGGATAVLGELTGGQYSMSLDANRNIAIVDHRNGGDVRPARTLSGGETFLASLALALALSEHVASLGTGSAARLESIFLDEGFGTLDPETLDVVRAAIEGLAERGRMVGVVTHVRDLAETAPVRFEVRKLAHTSVIDRVER